jgi:NADH oxidase (H2O2-forming)
MSGFYHLLILGGGAAGATAAFEARKFDPDIDIGIISKDRYTHYSPCGLPFAISGKIPDITNLIVYPPSLYTMSSIDLYLETTAERISLDEKKVFTNKGEFSYHKLIIATGSTPFIPPIKGVEKEGVFTIKGIDDGKRILKAISKADEVVVIGSGLIGLEMASAFLEKKLKVSLIEREERILPHLFDQDMANQIKEYLEDKGIKFYLNNEPLEILGDRKVSGILLKEGKIDADIVLFATGVKPNVKLAKEAGVSIGELGGIKINEKMETSIKDIFAAGDCVESIHGLVDKPISSMSMLGSTAVREGRIAGLNAVGKEAKLAPVLNTTISHLLNMEIGAVGLNSTLALENSFDIASAIFEGPSLDPFFPGGSKIVIKMVGDKKSGRLVGTQIIGKERVWGRILAVSFAMQKRVTVEELASAETAYVPSLSPTFDPITLTAEMLLRRMR